MRTNFLFTRFLATLIVSVAMLMSIDKVSADNNSPLCFTAKNGSVTVRFEIKNVSHTIQYSTDSTTWNIYTSNTNVNLNANQKVYFRATTNQTYATAFGSGGSNLSRFYFSSGNGGKIEGSGNIMSLYGPDCPNLQLQQYAFAYLFYNCSLLATAPILSATSLASNCYYNMFYGCTSLTSAPTLPATTLASYCYSLMFAGCTSLDTAPALPATTLAPYCYNYMFNGCTALTNAPILPATTMVSSCYGSMFSGCTSLMSAPTLPATTLAPNCYSGMFINCTSLTTAPTLPVTTLSDYCYEGMFSGCTSLTTAPALPATTLSNYCYNSMFSGCTSLTKTPDLPATVLKTSCYNSMFSGCTSLTSISSLPSYSLTSCCYASMFNGCTSLIVNTCPPGKQWKIPATSTYFSDAVSNMFKGTGGMMNGTPWLNHIYYIASSSYTVIVNANDSAMGNVTGGGQYIQGDTAILIAMANAGYHFVSWSNGQTTPTISVVVTSDTTLTASFAANPTYLIPENHSICQGESYTWRNRNLFTAGVYYDSLTTIYGSDSVYKLTLIVNSTYLIPETQSICQGATYTWRGRTLTSTGVYYDSLTTLAGCDSVYKLTLTVNQKHLIPETQSICQGSSYTWRGRTLTSAGVYYDSLTTLAGCDSVYKLTLTVNQKYLIPEIQSICQGSSYTWRGRTLTAAGVYYDSLTTLAGCDSIYKLTLTVNQKYLISETQSICQGSSYSWRGRTLNAAGVYYDSLTTHVGCDSVYKLTLTVNPTYFMQQLQSICQGESYNWHNKSLTTTGVYYDSLLTGKGCDSVYQLTLTVNPTYFFQESQTICQGETYDWHGKSITEAGIYYDSLRTANGCDSVYELTVTIEQFTISAKSNNSAAGKAYCNDEGKEMQQMTVECGDWVEIHAEAFADYHFVNWSDGIADSIRNIKVESDSALIANFEPNCGDWAEWPAPFLYNGLIMLNLKAINAMGYNPREEDVSWYQVVDEPDSINNAFPKDDKFICNGYYITFVENSLSYGEYYAVVDVSRDENVLCHDKMRTQIIRYEPSQQKTNVIIAPTKVHTGEVMTVTGLMPNENTTLQVYDVSGKVTDIIESTGRVDCQITTTQPAGVYMVRVISESVNTTLQFLVTK